MSPLLATRRASRPIEIELHTVQDNYIGILCKRRRRKEMERRTELLREAILSSTVIIN